MPMNTLNIGEIFYKDNETDELKKLGRPIKYSLECEAGSIPTLTADIGLTDFGNVLGINDLYPNTMTVSSLDDYCEIDLKSTNEFYEKIVLGLWNTEDNTNTKKEDDNMELLKMYEEYAKEIIENAINEEIESRLKANPTIRAFKELEEGFKKRCEDLFATQMRSLNLEDIAISEHHSGYMFKYGIASSYKHKVEEDVRNKYSHYITDLYDRLSEVEAHLKLIDANSTENDYANKLCVLYSYGIIDGNNHLIKYTIPTEENINENFCCCALENEVTEQPKKKRGRKPGSKNKKNVSSEMPIV